MHILFLLLLLNINSYLYASQNSNLNIEVQLLETQLQLSIDPEVSAEHHNPDSWIKNLIKKNQTGSDDQKKELTILFKYILGKSVKESIKAKKSIFTYDGVQESLASDLNTMRAKGTCSQPYNSNEAFNTLITISTIIVKYKPEEFHAIQ